MPRPQVLWITSNLSDGVARLFSSLPGFDFITVLHDDDLTHYAKGAIGGAVVIHVPSFGEQHCFSLMRQVHNVNGQIPVLLHDPGASLQDPAQVIQQGAFCVLSSDLTPNSLNDVLRIAIAGSNTVQTVATAANLVEAPWRKILIGESPQMQRVHDLIGLIAPRRSTVLVTGETGTGKEVLAKAIHLASGRARVPMVAVNCAAIPETLLEAELFGHAKGAYTGAVASRIGRFEQANGGTIFLDEIGDLPLETQGKLLRVLQEREFERVGGSETVRVDVRVIAATNVNLAEAVANKTFREDLFYRLNVVPLHLPPLRQRTGDIPLLVRHFVEKLCVKEGIRPKCVTPRAMLALERNPWRGNVRELEHIVEMAIVLSADRPVLDVEDFAPRQTAPEPLINFPEGGLDFENTISEIQRSLLRHALEKSHGNKSRAAEMLGMKRSTLVSKVKALG